jgi:DNA-binding winged helix-turn-helix (wHTH) protein
VLNDDAAKPGFIETVVGKGYRFIAEVEEIEAGLLRPLFPMS